MSFLNYDTASKLNSSLSKNIAIIDPDGSTRSAPTIIELIKRLESCGYICDLYIPIRYKSSIEFSKNIFICPRKFPSGSIFTRDFLRSLKDWIESLLGLTQSNIKSYRYAIGVNPEGIVLADSKFDFEELIYLSFEIFSASDTSSFFFKTLKSLERKASNNCRLIISQDSNRERFLRKNLGLSTTPFVNFPVAPASLSYNKLRTPPSIKKSINVFISGSISPFTRAERIIASVPSWPRNFKLIVNSNSGVSKDLTSVGNLRQIEFTEGNLREDDYVDLLHRMHIGIVGYSPIKSSNPFLMTNIELMGLSSGKLGFYTRSALPVILIGYSLPESLLSEYDFAVCIDDESQLPGALERIITNYSRHAAESRRFFDEVLSFDIHWSRLVDELKIVSR